MRFVTCLGAAALLASVMAWPAVSAELANAQLRDATGKAVGDAKLEAEGNADKIEGQVQNAVGGLKDTLKGK